MIKLVGNSGFDVRIICKKNKKYIEKSSDLNNFKRLKNQIKKQNKFYEKNIFNIPKILENYDNSFLMEDISGDNIIDYLSYCDNSQLNWLINEIISIIDKFINDCEYKFIDE